MAEINIKRYRHSRDKDYYFRVFDMHKEIFSGAGESVLPCVSKSMELGFLVMALYDKEVVGFGSCLPFHRFSKNIRDHYTKSLLFAANPDKYKVNIVRELKNRYEAFGKGDISLNFYDNEFTKEKISVQDDDFVFIALAVDCDHRLQGIGTMLAEERIKIAKENKASAVYVDCWEKGRSFNLYSKLGFKPIIKMSPVYPDGSSQMLMGLKLK